MALIKHRSTHLDRYKMANFADDIFKYTFLNDNHCVLIQISLKFDPKNPINMTSALVLIMASKTSTVLIKHQCDYKSPPPPPPPTHTHTHTHARALVSADDHIRAVNFHRLVFCHKQHFLQLDFLSLSLVDKSCLPTIDSLTPGTDFTNMD